MGMTKQGWEKRKANGFGTAWNKGLKGINIFKRCIAVA